MKRVLILCTGNSARSHMAEGLLRTMAGDHFEVFSAGTRPLGLNPLAVQVMREIGVDISHHRSKSVDEFAGQQFDYIITVCDNAREFCPVFSKAAGPTYPSQFPRPRGPLRLPSISRFPSSPRPHTLLARPICARTLTLSTKNQAGLFDRLAQ